VKYVPIAILVCLLYLLITADFSLMNIIISLAIGAGVSLAFRPERNIFSLKNFPAALWALFKYIFILIGDLLMSGIQVANILIQPKLEIKPGIITIPANCESELGNALSAHSITLTPGELVVELDEHGNMYTHVLDVTHADEYTAAAQERRRNLLRKIFP
jgi:multicomponent Na+:H+ antiporter subunit E